MNLVIFLFITTMFLFFLGSYVCSPKHNPRVKEVMADAEAERSGKRVTKEHPFSEDNIKIMGALFNGAAILLSTGLICWVPFFRYVAAISMAVVVVRFLWNRHVGGPSSNFIPVHHEPAWGSPNDGQAGRPGVRADGIETPDPGGAPRRNTAPLRRVGNHSETDEHEPHNGGGKSH
jgi:hypothetical protein